MKAIEIRVSFLQDENKILRELLWLRHGCRGIYGDDGERQCGQCMIDFKRDAAAKIQDRFEKIGLKALEDYAYQQANSPDEYCECWKSDTATSLTQFCGFCQKPLRR